MLKNSRSLLFILSILLCITFLIQCVHRQEEVETITEDGVEVVLNHIEPYKLEGEPSTFSLVEELSIDFERRDIGDLGIADALDFEVASDDSLYFTYSHKKDDLIFRFDNKGRFLNSFGKQGQGPGEIQFIMYSGIDARDDLVISDHVSRKILRFNKSGNLLDEIRYPKEAYAIFPLDNGNYIVFWVEYTDVSADYFWYGFSLFDASFKDIKVLDKYKYPSLIKKGRRGVNLNPFFKWKISDKHIYIGNEDRGYEILIFDFDGNLFKKIRKDYTPVKIPSDLIRKKKEQYAKRPDMKFWFPDFYLPICDFFPDDEGRLYVMTFERGNNDGEYLYDLFNPEGVFVARKGLKVFSWGEIATCAKVKGNRLYCFEEKEDGFRVFKVYKMIWK